MGAEMSAEAANSPVSAPVLYVPSHGGAGILKQSCGDVGMCTKLTPAWVGLLTMMQAARVADAAAGWPEDVQGFRTADALALSIANGDKYAYPLAPASVRKYLRRIQLAVRQVAHHAAGTSAENNQLFENRRGLGFRLKTPLIIARPEPR
jgi:hypothetical protein